MHWVSRGLLTVCVTLVTQAAGAQAFGSVASFLEAYPRGSIRSYAQADRALADAPAAQAAQEDAFKASRQACYKKLVAEGCLREAIEANAKAVRGIRAVQAEARDFRRREEDREAKASRDAKLAREAADAPRKQAEREQLKASRKQHQESQAKAQSEFEAGAAERAKRAAAERRRVAEKEAARARKDADEKASAATRAQRARDHEEKVRELTKRAREKEDKALRDKASGKAGAGQAVTPQSSPDVKPGVKP